MRYFPILLLLLVMGCDKDPITPIEPNPEMYFPPFNGSDWETTDPSECGWDEAELDELYDFLSASQTRAFIVLKNGKIVIEKYWGNNIINTAPFDQYDLWYWASAGKTMTAFLTGMAQEEGLLDINDKTSDYLGQGWTSMPQNKEDLITIKHQLTMTTGLDYNVDVNCITDTCLQYKADAGNQWFYHNAPYTLISDVLENASGQSYNDFTENKVANQIGIHDGAWIDTDSIRVYWSTPREAARFGLLILNKGKWKENQIMTDTSYFHAMVNTSQDINPSYGYLWWLNGKSSIVYPGLELSFNFPLSQSAPDELFAAMGKNGQLIEIIPSKNIVVVRMGDNPDPSAVPIQFHEDLWTYLSGIIGE